MPERGCPRWQTYAAEQVAIILTGVPYTLTALYHAFVKTDSAFFVLSLLGHPDIHLTDVRASIVFALQKDLRRGSHKRSSRISSAGRGAALSTSHTALSSVR